MAPTQRAQPPQNPPPVQWLQLRYCKRGRARFTSHQDFARAFERALRRAAIPMAYSSGFNPHPRVSYANASATGAATEADYLEIGLAERCEPADIVARLTDALPDGMAVLEASEGRGLVDKLTVSRWSARVPGVDAAALREVAEAFLAAGAVQVTRETKNGLRTFDARGAVESLVVDAAGDLELVLHHTTPMVRPDDVMQALDLVANTFAPTEPVVFTRLEQGTWADGRIVGPFEAPAGDDSPGPA